MTSKKNVVAKVDVCALYGHNYFQLHGEGGAIQKLACSKCGNTIKS